MNPDAEPDDDLVVVAVDVDGQPLAVVSCDDHTQRMLDAFVLSAVKAGRKVGQITDLGWLDDLPNAEIITAALRDNVGQVACPVCLLRQAASQSATA